MATFRVDDENAVALRRKAGIAITLINQSAVDVYMSREPAQLNASATGATPAGAKLAASGGQLQDPTFPGELWFRAASKTTIEVIP